MAFSINKFNTKKLFNVDTSAIEALPLEQRYRKLEDLYKENGPDKVYAVRAIYRNEKGLFDDAPTVVTDGFYVNFPAFMMSACDKIREDTQAVQAINAGLVGFKINIYTQVKYNKLCYTAEFVDGDFNDDVDMDADDFGEEI